MRHPIILCSLFLFLSAIAVPTQAHADLMADAVLDYQFQDFEKAEEKFNRLIQQEPDNIAAHYYLGMVLQQNGKVKQAIPHLERVKLASESSPIEGIDDALASAYLAADMPAKALPLYKAKYESNKQDETAAFNYAKALQTSGDHTSCRTIYRTLIASGGQFADASRYQMAQIFTDKKAYATAAQQLDEIDENSPYGDAAKAYKQALGVALKPLNLYVSSEWFFNDNASSGGTRINQSSPIVGSQGLTQIVALNTRTFEWTEDLGARISYLYYGMFHRARAAKSNDFIGHFINPALTLRTPGNTHVELKGDVQFFYFAQQKLSTNLGATLTATWESESNDDISLHAGYLDKKYTGQFYSAGIPSSLAYLDAKATALGIAGTLADEAGHALALDYTFSMERPTRTNSADATLATKSSDSKFNEQGIRLNATLPLSGKLSQFSIEGSGSYSYKKFLNRQDAAGLIYPTAANQFAKAVSSNYGARLQVTDMVKIRGYGISGSIGLEHTEAHSTASALTYKSNKYMGSISSMF